MTDRRDPRDPFPPLPTAGPLHIDPSEIDWSRPITGRVMLIRTSVFEFAGATIRPFLPPTADEGGELRFVEHPDFGGLWFVDTFTDHWRVFHSTAETGGVVTEHIDLSTTALILKFGGAEVARITGDAGHNLQGLAWTDFVPVLETTATQPVLGSTGNIAEGRWVQLGDTVFVQGQLRYGSVGETIGTGNYVLRFAGAGTTTPPPNAQTTMGHIASDGLPIGKCKINDNSTGDTYTVDLELSSNQQARLVARAYPAALVSTTSLFTVAEHDRFRFSFWYEAA